MNEQPLLDQSDLVLVCMKDGKFLSEEDDGHSTMTFWTPYILLAKRYHPVVAYGKVVTKVHTPTKPPAWYQKWPEVKEGARMVLVKINTTVWEEASGPIQTPTSHDETYPNG